MHNPTNQSNLDQETAKYCWNLSDLYKGPTDEQIDKDLEKFNKLAQQFATKYRNQLANKLAEAIQDFIDLVILSERPLVYLELLSSLDVGNQTVKAKLAVVEEKLAIIRGENLTFVELELSRLDEKSLKEYEVNPLVQKNLPWIELIRLFKNHLLSEPVESALTKREPFGASAWSRFYDEIESDLRINLPTENLTLQQALHRLSDLKSTEQRAEVLSAIHHSLGGFFLKYSAETLMNTVRGKALEDSERGYTQPMHARNLANRLDEQTVEALHKAVIEQAAPIARQYYQLKAKCLGLEKLAWSDRNAPLPFTENTSIPFEEAREIVETAYQAFSPTLAQLVREQFEMGRVDAAHRPGKRSGAFNLSFCLNKNQPISFTLLNYLGSARDVATLAHELGHAVHGLLAGQTQGPLLQQAPMAYAETASIFGEMITFNHLIEKYQKANDTTNELRLLMEKCEDFINSVVRQIGFSEFERRVHGVGRRLTPDEINSIWLETVYKLYGQDGDVFTYQNTERLWSYISHFHRPFYVYSYAVGELLTRTLFSIRIELGGQFEPLYLDLLRAGGSKSLAELLMPFNQNPTTPNFWSTGIKTFEDQLTQAKIIYEKLSK